MLYFLLAWAILSYLLIVRDHPQLSFLQVWQQLVFNGELHHHLLRKELGRYLGNYYFDSSHYYHHLHLDCQYCVNHHFEYYIQFIHFHPPRVQSYYFFALVNFNIDYLIITQNYYYSPLNSQLQTNYYFNSNYMLFNFIIIFKKYFHF